MIRIKTTQEMIDDCRLKAKALGSITNSITKGGGNLAGYLGEEAVASHIGADIVSNNRGRDKYNYDLLLPDGRRIEVKTKRRTVKPRPNYDVSVAHSSKHQRPDLYVFVSLEFERADKSHPKKYYGLQNAWLCGYMDANEFWERAILWKSGQIDPTNAFKTHVDMYNMAISDLYVDLETLDSSGKGNEICTAARPLGI
tara:strand:- start:4867 stop:5460 length:594 start_codon:yes stop_codon:yes gene_type:complete